MELWTFALRHVVTKWNNTPRPDLGFRTPEDVFNEMKHTKEPSSIFADVHPFGIPVYKLAKKLQDNKSLKKWEPRSQVGVYLGQSREYASNMSYALNPRTGHISAQYRLVYDDNFSTVTATTNSADIKRWEGLNKKQYMNTILLNRLP